MIGKASGNNQDRIVQGSRSHHRNDKFIATTLTNLNILTQYLREEEINRRIMAFGGNSQIKKLEKVN